MENRSKEDLITENEQLRKQIQEISITDNQEKIFQEVFKKSADALNH